MADTYGQTSFRRLVSGVEHVGIEKSKERSTSLGGLSTLPFLLSDLRADVHRPKISETVSADVYRRSNDDRNPVVSLTLS